MIHTQGTTKPDPDSSGPGTTVCLLEQSTKRVGVFDSGVGGLSVLKALLEHLPLEQFDFVADERYLPYGDKPQHEITDRVLTLSNWLRNQGCKAMVMACNTATAAGARCSTGRRSLIWAGSASRCGCRWRARGSRPRSSPLWPCRRGRDGGWPCMRADWPTDGSFWVSRRGNPGGWWR